MMQLRRDQAWRRISAADTSDGFATLSCSRSMFRARIRTGMHARHNHRRKAVLGTNGCFCSRDGAARVDALIEVRYAADNSGLYDAGPTLCAHGCRR